MNTFLIMTKRTMRLYFRDRSAVFFSLLSVLIVLLLMLVFLGDMNKNELLQLIQSTHHSITEDDAMHVIHMWTIAGILSVNAFTVPITMIGFFVQDVQKEKLASFLTTPVSRSSLIASYISSAILTSFLMGLIILGISYLYIHFSGYAFLPITQFLQILFYFLLNIIVSSGLVMVIAQWISTDHAWSAFSTLAGTLIGFLGGIYLPIGMLPDAVATCLKALPFLHETALLREIFTQQALDNVFHDLPAAYLTEYQEAMGITVQWNNQTIMNHEQIILLVIYGIITLSIALYMMQKRTKR